MRFPLKKVLFFVCGFLTIAALCFSITSSLDEGKRLLLEEYEPIDAHLEFSDALSANPTGQIENFWHAATVIAMNDSLKTQLQDVGILSVGNELVELFDKEGDSLVFNPESSIDTVIVDNSDGGYSDSGDWIIADPLEPDNPYDTSCRYHNPGTGWAMWQTPLATPGHYEISVWVPTSPNNTAEASYTVNGYPAVSIDQFGYGHANWKSLGVYEITTGSLHVSLSSDVSSGKVIADAIRVQYMGMIIDDGDSGVVFAPPGEWSSISTGSAYDGACHVHDVGSGATAQWNLDIPDLEKKYLLYVYNPTFIDNPAAEIQYELVRNGGDNFYFTTEQDGYSRETTCSGIYSFINQSANSLILHSSDEGKVAADMIRIIQARPYPDFSEIQSLFSNQSTGMINELNEALSNLSHIDNVNKDFYDEVTASHCPELPETVHIDYADAKMFESSLHMLKAFMHVNQVYDMADADIQYLFFNPGIFMNLVMNAYNAHENFGKLRGGVDTGTLLESARVSLVNSIECYLLASDYIRNVRNDGDGLNHLLILYNPYNPEIYDTYEEWLEEKEYALSMEEATRNNLQSVLNNLTDHENYPYAEIIVPDGISSEDLDLFNDVNVDLYEFFTNPKDIRYYSDLFLSKDIFCDSFSESTLGGILPELRPADWNYLFEYGIYEMSEPFLYWNNGLPAVLLHWSTVDSSHSSDIERFEIYRSNQPDVDRFLPGSELLETVYHSGDTSYDFIDDSLNPDDGKYYYRIYTFYDFGNGEISESYTDVEEVTLRLYVDAAYIGGNEDGSKNYPFSDLSNAVRQASSGTKVCVAAGVYNESSMTMWLGRNVGLTLEGGYNAADWTRDVQSNETIIDGTGLLHATIQISQASGMTIDGFTITGGEESGYGWSSAGVSVYDVVSAVIKNCKIIGNAGSGIQATHCVDLLIQDCTISGNSDRGIYCYDGSVDIINNIIEDNENYGIFISSSSSSATIKNNTILNNDGFAAVRYESISNLHVYNNIVYNNLGSYGIYGSGQNGLVKNNNSYGHAISDFQNCGIQEDEDGNISQDPLFVDGPFGHYYLSNVETWDDVTSPVVDAGLIETNPFGTAYTTRIDGAADSGTTDMGYHYPAWINGLAGITINEFLPNPNGSDSGNEWIELYNRSTNAVDLSGCIIDDVVDAGSSPQTIPGGTVIEANGFYTMNLPGSYLNNDGDSVNLLWPDSESIIDTYTYETTDEGGSFYRYPDGESWAGSLDYSPTKNSSNCPAYNPIVIAAMDGVQADDVVVDFGDEHGLWMLQNNQTWYKLHDISPEQVIKCNFDNDVSSIDDLVIDFGQEYGIWVYLNNFAWLNLHEMSAFDITTADIDNDDYDEIIINFGDEYGVWIYYPAATAWIKIHDLNPESTTVIQADSNIIAMDFGSQYGIWLWNANDGFSQLHALSPESVYAADLNNNGHDESILDFGSEFGIWVYDEAQGSWWQLHHISSEYIASGDIDIDARDDLIIDFGNSYGIWTYKNNTSWELLHEMSPEWISVGDVAYLGTDDIVVDFGDEHGLWIRYSNETWEKLHEISP